MKVREGFAESSGQGGSNEGAAEEEGDSEAVGRERSFPERRRPIERLKNSLACMSNLYTRGPSFCLTFSLISSLSPFLPACNIPRRRAEGNGRAAQVFNCENVSRRETRREARRAVSVLRTEPIRVSERAMYPRARKNSTVLETFPRRIVLPTRSFGKRDSGLSIIVTRDRCIFLDNTELARILVVRGRSSVATEPPCSCETKSRREPHSSGTRPKTVLLTERVHG